MDKLTKFNSYINQFIKEDNSELCRLQEEENKRKDVRPCIGKETGKLLGTLIRFKNARRVLELGTCLGYSTIWICEALKETGGTLVTVERKSKLVLEAEDNLKKAELYNYVNFIDGEADEIIYQLDGPFDLILLDIGKSQYSELLDRCIELTRRNGMIVADDTLFKARGFKENISNHIDRYNKQVFADKRLYSTILPIGDGVTLSVKLRD